MAEALLGGSLASTACVAHSHWIERRITSVVQLSQHLSLGAHFLKSAYSIYKPAACDWHLLDKYQLLVILGGREAKFSSHLLQ